MKIGILGAGAGGSALAYELSNKGYEVVISDMPDYLQNVEAIKNNGGVYSQNEGGDQFAAVKGVNEIQEVVEETDVIFIVTPAFGTKPFAEACKPYIRRGQKFIICPGSGGGALEFKSALGVDLLSEDIIVAETHTLPYAVRVIEPGYVHIYLYVNKLIFATLPSTQNGVIYESMNRIWPGIVKMAKNVLETTFIDGNPVIHPPVTLMNAALIERTKGDFRFYADGITDGVANIMQAVDEERLALAKAFGITIPSEPEMSNEEGYIEDGLVNYKQGYNHSKAFEPIKAQDRLDHRYFTEDVGYVMVFWSTLGELIGVKTPVIDAIITMTSRILDRDLRSLGFRTTHSLGITKEILANI